MLIFIKNTINLILFLGLFFNSTITEAQNDSLPKPKSVFLQKVRFGGGLGLGISNGYTNISVAPSGIYPLNSSVSVGAGVQFGYTAQKNTYNSFLCGGSLIGLFMPIEQLQISTELEELYVTTTFNNLSQKTINKWTPAIFLGAGYYSNGIAIGIRYNILYKTDNAIYGQAWMPFVRAYF